MTHPYLDLPDFAFWRKAVAEQEPLAISGVWKPKFKIQPRAAVATYGSCFAQHIGKALRERGFHWLDAERPPEGSNEAVGRSYNYGVFSSRTANIYTTSLLRQWLEWASGASAPPEEFWQAADGRVVDPFRPAIEQGGFASVEEMLASRQHTLRCFKASVEGARYFVFTLGLTESWFHTPLGHEYPMCPGTVAGTFDPAAHQFVNQRYGQVLKALKASIRILRSLNPNLKVLLTVSPVPLTATASGQHVLLATQHSKAILRAVAAEAAETVAGVDYFPSYELITSPCFGGRFFEANQRQVTPEGVAFVMGQFFAALQAAGVELPAQAERGRSTAPPKGKHNKRRALLDALRRQREAAADEESETACEEALLDAFGKP
jgi:hypothetical protein